MGIEAVFASGQRSLEHLIGIKRLASEPFTAGTLDMDKVNELAAKANIANTWHTPTNTVNSLSATDAQQIRTSSEFSYISPGSRQSFINGFHQGLSQSIAFREDANQKTISKALYDAGVELLVGSDSGFGYMIPGFAFHNELQSFIDMGLTPYQTLRAATASPGTTDVTSVCISRLSIAHPQPVTSGSEVKRNLKKTLSPGEYNP